MTPVVTTERFAQAGNRLEVLRGIARASDKLLLRLLTRFDRIVIRDRVLSADFTLTDLGPR